MIKRNEEVNVEEIEDWDKLQAKVQEYTKYGASFDLHDDMGRCEVGYKNSLAVLFHYPFGKGLQSTNIACINQEQLKEKIEEFQKQGIIFWGTFPKLGGVGFTSYCRGYEGDSDIVYVKSVNLNDEKKFDKYFSGAIMRSTSKSLTPLFDYLQLNMLNVDKHLLKLHELLL